MGRPMVKPSIERPTIWSAAGLGLGPGQHVGQRHAEPERVADQRPADLVGDARQRDVLLHHRHRQQLVVGELVRRVDLARARASFQFVGAVVGHAQLDVDPVEVVVRRHQRAEAVDWPAPHRPARAPPAWPAGAAGCRGARRRSRRCRGACARRAPSCRPAARSHQRRRGRCAAPAASSTAGTAAGRRCLRWRRRSSTRSDPIPAADPDDRGHERPRRRRQRQAVGGGHAERRRTPRSRPPPPRSGGGPAGRGSRRSTTTRPRCRSMSPGLSLAWRFSTPKRTNQPGDQSITTSPIATTNDGTFGSTPAASSTTPNATPAATAPASAARPLVTWAPTPATGSTRPAVSTTAYRVPLTPRRCSAGRDIGTDANRAGSPVRSGRSKICIEGANDVAPPPLHHAVVIGASMAGLTTAASWPTTPTPSPCSIATTCRRAPMPRKAVPQGRHAHTPPGRRRPDHRDALPRDHGRAGRRRRRHLRLQPRLLVPGRRLPRAEPASIARWSAPAGRSWRATCAGDWRRCPTCRSAAALSVERLLATR